MCLYKPTPRESDFRPAWRLIHEPRIHRRHLAVFLDHRQEIFDHAEYGEKLVRHLGIIRCVAVREGVSSALGGNRAFKGLDAPLRSRYARPSNNPWQNNYLTGLAVGCSARSSGATGWSSACARTRCRPSSRAWPASPTPGRDCRGAVRIRRTGRRGAGHDRRGDLHAGDPAGRSLEGRPLLQGSDPARRPCRTTRA